MSQVVSVLNTMIERRIVLTGLVATLATPALAQNPPGGTSDVETQHIKRTAAVGSLSLAVSRIAVKRATNPRLKEFAQFEVAEQETVANVLKSLENPSNVSGAIEAPSDAEVRQNLDQQGQQALRQMESARGGAVFDRDYLRAELEGHRQLLQIQEDYLKIGKRLPDVITATLARGMIKEHLQLLADIENQTNFGTTGTGTFRH